VDGVPVGAVGAPDGTTEGTPDGGNELDGTPDGAIVGVVGKAEGVPVGVVGFPDGAGVGAGLAVGIVEGL